jgi:pimeloyl-ACP methyl ester carboxylesterase
MGLQIQVDIGQNSILNTRDSKTGYESLMPPGFDMENATPARIFLTMALYRPTSVACRVKCPALVIAGENDFLIPIEAVKKAAAKMKRAEFMPLPLNHFDPYLGEPFNQVSKKQLDFLKTHL